MIWCCKGYLIVKDRGKESREQNKTMLSDFRNKMEYENNYFPAASMYIFL